MADECPSLERLATYLDHNLDEAEVRLMEAHLVACQACRRLVVAVVQSQQAVPDPVIPQSRHRSSR